MMQGKRFELSNGLTDQALNLTPLTTRQPLLMSGFLLEEATKYKLSPLRPLSRIRSAAW